MSLLSQALGRVRRGLRASLAPLRRGRTNVSEISRRRAVELAALVKASASLVEARDEGETVELVLRTAMETFPSVDTGALFLDEAGILVARAALGYDMSPLSQVRLRPGESIAGQVFQLGKPLVCHTPEEVSRALETATSESRGLLLAARRGKDPQSMVGVPLRHGESVLGSLVLASLSQRGAFQPQEVEVLQAFASHVASILEKGRLLREAGEVRALKEADQMKRDFLSAISHELQTPLASLRASLEFLSPEQPGGEIQAKLLDNARRNAESLQKLVNDLIDVARIENLRLKLELEPLDLRQVVRQAAESFGPLLAEKGRALETAVPAEPVMVLGDERRLEQALNNLLMNAYKHTPAESGPITLGLEQTKEQAIVSVKDRGPGIPPEKKERLFERFYSGSPRRGSAGLGLGLAIARGLVELHQGRLWVESEPGKGSAFSFSLPIARKNEDPSG